MLTAKQEAFVKGIIDGMSQADAYRQAYPNQKASDKTIHENASRLMANPKVLARVEELRKQMMNPTIMSAQERLEYLTRVVQGIETEKKVEWDDGKAVTCEEPASIKTRLQAIDLMNKMQGEYVQKVVADVDTTYTINIELEDDDEEVS